MARTVAEPRKAAPAAPPKAKPAERRSGGAASVPTVPRRDFFEETWTLFCSVRFAVVQILVLATATTLGTLIPQMPVGVRDFPRDYADFITKVTDRFGPFTGVMLWAGFFDLYNSFWFRLLIVLLCYSIIICTLNRWGPIMRLINPPHARTSEAFLLGLSERAQFSGVPLAPAAAQAAIGKALKRDRYRLLTNEKDGTLYIYADRDRWSKLVTFGSHAALVMLIITAAGMTQIGWREQSVFFQPNVAVNVGHGTDFDVRQNSFNIDYYPGTTDVKEYWSNLSVIQGGQEVLTKTIRVNDPLRYNDINFFLVSYVEGAKVVADDSAGTPLVLNQMGESGPITNTDTTGAPMYLSFGFTNEDNLPMDMVQLRRPGQDTVTLQLVNYSSTPRAADENPALFAKAYIGQDFDHVYYNDFIPRKGPLTIPEIPGVSWSFERSTATVMEVAEDHGLTMTAIWFVLMSLGFALSLFITFVRTWAIIKPNAADPSRSDIILAGLAEKNKISYEREFEKTALRVRDELAKLAAGTASREPAASQQQR